MVSEVIGDRLFSAMVTPMRPDESVDRDAIGVLADAEIGRGVEGLYVCGSSGEGVLLTESERRGVIDAAIEAAGGRVPVVAHVGAMSTGEATRLAESAAAAGAAAISMIPPLYYGYSTAEVAAHFRAVVDAVEVPFLLYNIPQFTGRDISEGGFDELLELPRVVGVKHTSRNLYGAERILRRHENVSVVNGFDETYLPALSVGARGTIGTTVGLQIELFRSVRRRFDAGDLAGARIVQTRVNDTVEKMVSAGIFGATKYLAGKYSTTLGACRRPLPTVTDTGRRRLDDAWRMLEKNIEDTLEEDARS